MKTAFFALIAILTATPSIAADTLVLDPSRVTCRIGAGEDRQTLKCDVLYDNLLVHVGRSTSEATANGDCVKCRGVLDEAISLGKNVRMLRGYWTRELADWHLQEFFVVNERDKRCN